MPSTLYLVTGAAGFLGSTVCRQLVQRGDSVRAFVLPDDPSSQYIPEEVEQCPGDLRRSEDIDRFFTVDDETTTVVIHCASMVTINPDFNQTLIDINVGGTKNIIEACLNHPECQKLVYVSSTGAIPEPPQGHLIKEVDHFDADGVIGWYSRSKALASQAVLDAVHEHGLNACIVHPSGILGPEDHAVGETTGTIIKIINGEMPIGMRGSFNLCDVRDLAQGCIQAADLGRTGQCYILANKEVTLKELSDILSQDLDIKPIRFFLPLGLSRILARSMEKKAARTGSKPLMTSFSVYNLARNNAFDYSKAETELGYKTRTYAQTLHDEAVWLKQEQKIRF